MEALYGKIRLITALGVALALSGCNTKAIDALEDGHKGLLAKQTQSETRLNSIESQLSQLSAELVRTRTSLAEMNAKPARPVSKPTQKKVVKAPSKKLAAAKKNSSKRSPKRSQRKSGR